MSLNRKVLKVEIQLQDNVTCLDTLHTSSVTRNVPVFNSRDTL